MATAPYAEAVHTTVSWRAIFAGTFIALLTYLTLTSLGIAFGSSALQGVIQGQDSASGLGWGTGIWLAVTALISLFVGSYAAARVSGPIPMRIGRVQGAVITALFFTLMLSQVGSTIGALGRGAGSVVGALRGSAGDLAQNPQVQSTLDQALGDLNLKSPPEVVAQGLATRLLRGDGEGAKNYLANQAGITPGEADQRLASLQQKVTQIATEAGTQAAKVAQIAGWTMFGALLLGSLSAMFGGGLGAGLNLRHPVSRSDERALRRQRAA